ncbi:amino acid ABC transporter permease [Streptococcus suis]|uniref:amino acid ABC transporter permease n=1 Tax=Streptococcus parasuis TaxID=1501662 RepID=UPI001552E7C8|nr:amino acid ABC transporter permease [Streptococcus suis]NQK67789.1 amino acid ABC transporter permease [Streptococcus suis]NQM12828.1 amino acid ABC transporter permease [Streptococcus suis]NQM54415.1 amino acid ABC transporter permease [Streptococcus suis]WNF87023.1 amino acid ABC transporter permease [Streptococcus parasuis]
MKIEYIIEILPSLVSKIPVVFIVFILSFITALILAIVIVLIRKIEIPIINTIVIFFISFSRSVPGLVHLFLVFYGLPSILLRFNIDINSWNKVYFSILALCIYHGSIISEIIRPAFEAIPKTQFEAGISIGMTSIQTVIRIIIPQMFPIILPSICNTCIDLFLDTSLLFIIGVADIMGQAKILSANSFGIYQIEIYFTVALIYWFFCWVIGRIFIKLERYTNRFLMN